jgi:hypothetical protein
MEYNVSASALCQGDFVSAKFFAGVTYLYFAKLNADSFLAKKSGTVDILFT